MRYFSETQRFNQWWLIAIMASWLLVIVGVLATSYKTIEPQDQDSFIVAATATGIVMSLITLLIFSIKLITKIDEQGIHYQFYPFHQKEKLIIWEELVSCHLRTYQPISEFGGWGYKVGFRRNYGALNIRGDQGIQLILANGKKLLIGTQKAEEAQRTLNYYAQNDKSYG